MRRRKRRGRHPLKLLRRGKHIIVRNGKFEMILPPPPSVRGLEPIRSSGEVKTEWQPISDIMPTVKPGRR